MRLNNIRNSEEVLSSFFDKELKSFNKSLTNFIGQQKVKEALSGIVPYAINGRMEDIPKGDQCYTFLGEAGTGKSSSAELFARAHWLFRKSRYGHIVIFEGSKMQAGFAGQTGSKVTQAIKVARGGLLFLDEVYALCSGKDDTYGRQAISTITGTIGGPQMSDIVWIAAGYEKEVIDNFIGSNEGLQRRFQRVDFVRYSASELVRIFQAKSEPRNMTIKDEALGRLSDALNRGDLRSGQAGTMVKLLDCCSEILSWKNQSSRKEVGEKDMVKAIQMALTASTYKSENEKIPLGLEQLQTVLYEKLSPNVARDALRVITQEMVEFSCVTYRLQTDLFSL